MLYANTRPCEDGVRRESLEVPMVDDTARAKAQEFAGQTKAILIMAGVTHPGILIACSGDSGFNAGVILRNALAEVGGRGGGTATLAQGNISDPRVISALRQGLGFQP
jgi:alanyl-tRNA synthetase